MKLNIINFTMLTALLAVVFGIWLACWKKIDKS